MIKDMQSRRRKYPRIAKIRLGEKKISKGSGKEYPSALDHFSFVDAPWISEIYPHPCRRLAIMLPSEDFDYFFPQRLAAYRQSGLFCACDDGEFASRSRLEPGKDPQGEAFLKESKLDFEVGTRYEIPCPYQDCGYYQKKECKRNGRFLFMLLEVQKVGLYEITTGSWNSIANINDYLEFLQSTVGRVSGIPLDLIIGPQEVHPDGKKKVVQTLRIEFVGTWQDLYKYKRKQQIALPPGLPTKAEIESHTQNDFPDDLYPPQEPDTRTPSPASNDRVSRARQALNEDGGSGEPEMPATGTDPQPEAEHKPPVARPPRQRKKAPWQS